MPPRLDPSWRALATALPTTAIALALAAGTASADGARPASLGWVRAPGAEGCIGTAALARAVEARLGKSGLASASRAEVSIEGRIAPTEDAAGWQVALTVADDTGKVLGTRALVRQTTDCRSMDEDVILTVALLIDPDAALAPPPDKAPPPATTAPPPLNTPVPVASSPVPPLPVSPSPSVADRPRKPWNAAFLGGPILSFGALPNVGVGLQIRALVTPVPVFAFQVGGSVWAPQTASFGATGGQFFLATGALSACPLTGVARGFRYAACAGAEAGLLHAGGVGFPVQLQRDNPVVNGVLEARVVRAFAGPLAGSLGLGLSVPFLQRQYYYLDSAGAEREVFATSPVTGSVDLLVGFDL